MKLLQNVYLNPYFDPTGNHQNETGFIEDLYVTSNIEEGEAEEEIENPKFSDYERFHPNDCSENEHWEIFGRIISAREFN